MVLPSRPGSEEAAQVRAILDAALDAVVGMDEGGRVSFWNRQAELTFGWAREEALGRLLSDLIIPAELRQAHQDGLRRFLETGETVMLNRRVEVRALRRDGSTFAAELTITSASAGGEYRFTAFLRDVTERQRTARRLLAQYGITKVVAESSSVAEAVPRILASACESLDWDVGAYWNLDERASALLCGELWMRHGASFPRFEPATRALRLRRGQGLPGRVWAEGRPTWISDLLAEPGLPRVQEAAADGLRSCLGFPLRLGGEDFGVLEFFSRAVREPDEDMLRMVESIGQHVGQLVQRERAAEAALARTRVEALAADVGLAFARADDMATLLQRCAEAVVTRLDVLGARIWTVERPEEVLVLAASAGPVDDGAGRRIPFGEGRLGQLAREPRAYLTSEVAADPLLAGDPWVRSAQAVSFAAHPVMVNGQIEALVALVAAARLAPATVEALRAVTQAICLVMTRKRAEEERRFLLAREQKARRDAETANRLKDEFLATLSHELRTPLNAIIGWTHMLRSGSLDAATAERALEAIDRNANAQNQLISDLLDVSRIISGKMRLSVQVVELQSVVEAAVDTVRHAAEAKGISLQRVAPSEPARVSGDPDRLQQVIWNLLSNAIRFTPRGGLVLARLECEGGYARLAVEDTGPGIDEAFLPHIFDRFRQADSTSTRSHGGLGLGLAIVRHLVELHGGSVAARNRGDRSGAVFDVQLPLRTGAQAQAPAAVDLEAQELESGEAESVPSLLGLRVLVVEDEPDAREVVTRLLEQKGATVHAVPGVAAAFERIGHTAYDVILCDIEMPGADGYSFVRRLRARPAEEGGRTPAAALTAYASSRDRLKALQAGFQIHVAKPVHPTELITVVASLALRHGEAVER